VGTGSRGDPEGLLTHAEAVRLFVHNILVAPSPLYRLADWIAPIEASALGLTQDQKRAVNDDRMGRALDAIASQRGRSIFFRLALRILKEFDLDTRRIHFDTTTVTLFGEYRSSIVEPVICNGINKDHRPDLKQLLFGLNVTADGAVPLLHNVFSGNRTDDTVHRGNVEALRRILQREDFIYVADCKLCTRANLRYIDKAGGKFVTVLPRSRREDKLFREYLRNHEVSWYLLDKIPSKRRLSDPPDIFYTCKSPFDLSEEGYRIIWIKSSEKARLDAAKRQADLDAAFIQLEELSQRLNRGKLKTKARIGNAVASILSSHGVKEFVRVKIHSRTQIETRHLKPGRPRPFDPVKTVKKKIYSIEASLNEHRLWAESQTDGVFPLITNLPKSYTKRQVLMIYKYQPYLEKRFASLKSELLVSPVFLKKPTRVAGLMHAYFIAICVASLMERTVRSNMRRLAISHLPLLPEARPSETPTAPRILEAFSPLSWHQFTQGDNLVTFPLQLEQLQLQILALLEVPKTVYS
jgi:transposase